MMANNMEPLCVKTLFSNEKYLVPIYQRNYAWGEQELAQLIQDILDYSDKKQNYYIGTLVVYEKNIGGSMVYEIIDGQQRLTALTIILDVIKNEFKNDYATISDWYKAARLDFKSRKISTNTLQILFESPKNIDSIDYNPDIKQAYDTASKILKSISKDKLQPFFDHLLHNVYILRAPVPNDTDLNHYFEIMNTRGEQLEKHEIVKSLLIGVLSGEPNGKILSGAFNAVWEACSNMERYIQYGFTVDLRRKIFGDNWDTIKCNDFDGLSSIIASSDVSVPDDAGCQKLEEIIASPEKQNPEAQTLEPPERFNSIISFSNFLLHVLKIQEEGGNIALDDKQLIDMFESALKNKTQSQQVGFVKDFGYNLLKCKFLFDQYVIKRDINKDHWSLLRLKNINDSASYVNTFGSDDDDGSVNRDMLMLLSMFHVSFPTQIYKYWLYAVLSYSYKNNITHDNSANYKKYLQNLAEAFLLDRFLASKPVDYDDIISKNEGSPKNTIGNIDKAKLDRGVFVENFIFNYLDYLLWDKDKTKYSSFEFTFRSSVEHYYPRHPMEGFPVLEENVLDCFGNLCLISSGRNSKLSNYMPQAKKEHYRANPSVESIKQRIMMEEYEGWGKDEIEKHGEEMKKILFHEEL